MKKLLLSIFSFICLSVHAQQWLWAYPINTNGGSAISNIEMDSLKNPVIIGICASNPNGFIDSVTFLGNNGSFKNTKLGTFVAKYDSFGNINWIGGGWGNPYVHSSSIDKHGNIYLSGEYEDTAYFGIGNDTLETSATTVDYFLTKLDRKGKAIILKAGGGSCQDEGTLVKTFSNEEIINYWIDETYCNYAGNWIKHFEKLNSSGTLIWSLPLPSSFYYLDFYQKNIARTTDNGFLLSDSWWGYSNLCFPGLTDSVCLLPPTPPENTDVYLVKYSLNGNPQWGKAIRGNNLQSERNITVDSSNNIILAIAGIGITYYDSIMMTPKGNYYTEYIVKADSLGNLINYLGFNSSYPPFFNIKDLKADAHGNIYFMVNTDSDFSIGQDSLHFNIPQNGRAIAIVKLDKNLNYLWSQYVIAGYNDGGTMAITDSIVYLGINYDVPAILNGSSYQFPAPNSPSMDAFIGAIRNTSIPLSISESKNLISLNIFPNPSSGIFTVQIRNCQAGAKITVHDVLGNCLLEHNCRGEFSQEINLSCQPRGIYFVELLSGDERVVRKVAVQ